MESNPKFTTVDSYRNPLLLTVGDVVEPTFHEMKEEDTVLRSTSRALPYRRRFGEQKQPAHWGQRKLLMSEIQFFTRFWDSSKLENAIVVYAGAAPGIHIPVLSLLFPNLTFHCYDPRPFRISQVPQIRLHQELFTDDIARQWAGRQDVFFLSDIRSMGPGDGTPEEVENAVIQDHILQERWVRIMSPVEALLKFRLPYLTTRNISSERIVDGKFRYLRGLVFFQAWSGATSSETRLVPSRPYTSTDWDIQTYEDRLFYRNSEVREKFRFLDPANGDPRPLDPPELMSDADSTLEGLILVQYITKYLLEGETLNPRTVISISRLITELLNTGREASRYCSLDTLRNNPDLRC